MQIRIELLLSIITILGTAWTVLMWIPRMMIAVHEKIERYTESVNQRFVSVESTIDSVNDRLKTETMQRVSESSALEARFSHRLELSSQGMSMSLDRLSERFVSLEKSVNAIHKRLDSLQIPPRSDNTHGRS